MKFVKSLILSLLLICISTITVFAEDIYGHGYFEYKLNDGGIEIVNYLGNEEEIYVPYDIASYPVYKISKGAFINCEATKTIYLPDTVTSIEEGAFREDIKLEFNYNVTDNSENDYRIDIPQNENTDTEYIEIQPNEIINIDEEDDLSNNVIINNDSNTQEDIKDDSNNNTIIDNKKDSNETNNLIENIDDIIEKDTNNYLLIACIGAAIVIIILIIVVTKKIKRKKRK